MDNQTNRLDLVRQILTSPVFLSKSVDERQDVLREIIETGEISQQDLDQVLQENEGINQSATIAYLEQLPYNLFVNIITSGQIEGVDLINLCNSSPLISEKCNKSLTPEDVNGRISQEIPQFLFFQLIRKMGLEPSMERWHQGESFREQYIKAYRNLPIISLNRKLSIVTDLSAYDEENEGRIVFPGNLFDLLYNTNDLTIGILDKITAIGISPRLEDNYVSQLKLINILYEIREDLITQKLWKARDSEGWIKVFQYSPELPEIAKVVGKDLDEFLATDYQEAITILKRVRPQMGDPKIEDLLNVNQSFARAAKELFAAGKISDKRLEGIITHKWSQITIDLFREYDRQLKNAQNKEEAKQLAKDIDLLQKQMILTDQDLDYLIYLHKRVLDGTIPVLTFFTFEELSKY